MLYRMLRNARTEKPTQIRERKAAVSDNIFYGVFIFTSLLLYLPILWGKFALSRNYSDAKYSVYFIYKTVFAFLHWNLLQTGYIPFIGKKDISLMGWVSMLMILAYLVTSPDLRKDRSKLSRDPLSPINILLPSSNYRATQQRRAWTIFRIKTIMNLVIYGGITAFLILI